MNQQQKKYLRDLVENEHRHHSSAIYNSREPMPAAVKRAQALVAKWNKQVGDKNARRRAALTAAKQAITQTILFGKPDEALAAIERFRKQTF